MYRFEKMLACICIILSVLCGRWALINKRNVDNYISSTKTPNIVEIVRRDGNRYINFLHIEIDTNRINKKNCEIKFQIVDWKDEWKDISIKILTEDEQYIEHDTVLLGEQNSLMKVFFVDNSDFDFYITKPSLLYIEILSQDISPTSIPIHVYFIEEYGTVITIGVAVIQLIIGLIFLLLGAYIFFML